jgi:hypothetical protein
VINGHVTHEYLGNNFIAVPEELISITSLIKYVFRESVIASTHYIYKALLCPRSNDADGINEETLRSLDRKVKIL